MAKANGRPRSADLMMGAARIRAEERGSEAGAKLARRYEGDARAAMPSELVTIGVGGELVPAEGPDTTALALRNTVSDPDYVAADASRARLELAQQAGALELALDTADTIEAANSVEKMLAHQLAALHRSALLMTAQMNRQVERLDVIDVKTREAANVQACRLAGAVSRLSLTFQQGMLTLQRMRTGGRQVVTVQHLNVSDGGQAIVTGNIGGGEPCQRRPGRGSESAA